MTLTTHHVNTAPTVGQSYTYRLEARANGSAVTQGINNQLQCSTCAAAEDGTAVIKVVMECGS